MLGLRCIESIVIERQPVVRLFCLVFFFCKRCGFLAGKGHLGSLPVQRLRKLPKELMELVSLPLLQVFSFYLGLTSLAFFFFSSSFGICAFFGDGKSHSGL